MDPQVSTAVVERKTLLDSLCGVLIQGSRSDSAHADLGIIRSTTMGCILVMGVLCS